MPGLRFAIPVGATADVKELEYIVALHQTGTTTRSNATISSQDVKALLQSRYELNITHNQAIAIVRSLGGGDTEIAVPSAEEEGQEDDEDASDNKEAKSSKTVSRVWDATFGFVTDPFGRKISQRVSGGDDDDNTIGGAAAEEKENNKVHAATPSNNNKQADMKELSRMHAAHQQGEKVDTKSWLLLKERIVTSLQQRVVRNTTRHHHNNHPSEDNDAQVDDDTNPADDVDEVDVSDASAKNAAEDEESAADGDENGKGADDGEPEFLDMVQILSTILIPTVARITRDVREAKGNNTPDALPDDEPPREDAESSSFQRLWTRFLAYGRRKLDLDDRDNEEERQYSSVQVFQLAKQALVGKAFGSRDDDNVPVDVVVDESLVQLLLIAHGEMERALNQSLVREMAQMAQSTSGLFDDEALWNAISSDLSRWEPSNEAMDTTFFDDVFGVPAPMAASSNFTAAAVQHYSSSTARNKSDEGDGGDMQPQQNAPLASAESDVENNNDDPSPPPVDNDESVKEEPNKLDFNINLGGTDLVLDSQVSFTILVFIWLSFIGITTVFGALLFPKLDFEMDCRLDEFWCIFVETVVNWAVLAAMLSALGLLHVHPISFGNSPSNRTVKWQMFAAVLTLLYTILPYLSVKQSEEDINPALSAMLNYSLMIGCALVFMLLLQTVFAIFVKTDRPHTLPALWRILVSVTSWNSEICVHRAAKRKVAKLLARALELHENDKSSNSSHQQANEPVSGDQVMHRYVLHGGREKEVGGVFWTWWKVLDGSLFNHEGIWLNARLCIIQTAQVAVGGFITIISFVLFDTWADDADDYREEVKDDEVPDWVLDAIPTGAMIRGSFYPAILVAFVAMVLITILYVPSAVGTILKYRYSVLPSLGSPYFEKYRDSVDSTHMNTANALYGMIGMAVLVDLVVGGIIFLFLWPPSQDGAVLLLAWGLGLGVTICLKMALTMTCRMIQYRAFYRIRPSAARITSLALECWYLGLAGSVLLARVGQFLFAAVFWVGRIDVPFLSEDVSLLGYAFDYVPSHFFKDLLVHEAHRHPYIERLAQMYLMKVRHGENFVSDAGSAWRQLLVTALLPWLTKHRVFSDQRRLDAKAEAKDVKEREADEAQIYKGGVTKGVKELGEGLGREVLDAGQQVVEAGRDVGSEISDGIARTAKSGGKKTDEVVMSEENGGVVVSVADSNTQSPSIAVGSWEK